MAQPSVKATPPEVREHVRMAMSLVSHGISKAEVRAQLAQLYGLDENAADRATAAAWAEMREGYRLSREDHRILQYERLKSELAAAKTQNRYTAVASIEKLIMQLMGTAAPVRLNVEVSSEERERVLGVVMALDEQALKALIEGEPRVALGHAIIAGAESGEPE